MSLFIRPLAFLFVLIIIFNREVIAQGAYVETGESVVNLGETYVLALVFGEDKPEYLPDFPHLPGFSRLNMQLFERTKMQNGVPTAEYVVSQHYKPLFTGVRYIPPVTIHYAQLSFRVAGANISVVSGYEGPSLLHFNPAMYAEQEDDAVLEWRLSNDKPVIGEPCYLTLHMELPAQKAYLLSMDSLKPQLDNISQKLKEEGVWMDIAPMTEVGQEDFQKAGVAYVRYVFFRAVLFFYADNNVTIPEVSLELGKYSNGRYAPKGSYDLMKGKKTYTATKRNMRIVSPDVGQALVAVGTFSIRESLSSAQCVCGTPVRYALTITGEGNMAVAPDPTVPQSGAFIFNTVNKKTATAWVDDKFISTVTYEWTLTPMLPGTYPIADYLSFQYYDMYQHRMQQLKPVMTLLGQGQATDDNPIIQDALVNAIQKADNHPYSNVYFFWIEIGIFLIAGVTLVSFVLLFRLPKAKT